MSEIPKPVQKVIKALSKFRPLHTLRGQRLIPKRVYIDIGSGTPGVYIRLPDGSWTNNTTSGLEGYVEGFNVYAHEAAPCLVALGYIRKDDSDAFRKWFQQRLGEIDRQIEIDRAHETLRKWGCDVAKKVEQQEEEKSHAR